MSTQLVALEPEMEGEIPAHQLEMMLGDNRPKIDFSKPEFSYTAERLWRDRPDVAKAAIKLLAEPREVMPYRRIMGRLHISYHLLRALEQESSGKIAETKQSLAQLSASVTRAAGEKTMELIPTMKNAKDAAVVAGIFGDKFLQFSDQATQRIEITATVNVHTKMDELYRKIGEKFEQMKVAKAHVVEPAALEESHTKVTEVATC